MHMKFLWVSKLKKLSAKVNLLNWDHLKFYYHPRCQEMFVDAYITQKSNFFSRKYIENTQNTLLHMVKSLSKPASVIPPLNHAWTQIVRYAKISFKLNLWKSYTPKVFRIILLNGINGKKVMMGELKKVQKQGKMKDLLNSPEDQIKPFLFHYFINKEQV